MLREMRAEEFHVFLICTGKSNAGEKLKKLLRQKGSTENKLVLSEPGLLTTTCMRPPVVSKIAHTKSRYPGGIQTNPKIIVENFGLYSLKAYRCITRVDYFAFAISDDRFVVQSKMMPYFVGPNWIFPLPMIKLRFTEGRNEIITKRPST